MGGKALGVQIEHEDGLGGAETGLGQRRCGVDGVVGVVVGGVGGVDGRRLPLERPLRKGRGHFELVRRRLVGQDKVVQILDKTRLHQHSIWFTYHLTT